MKFTKHGFTLIELLVVIAIIAILAAILFPVFAQAREKARQASCLSNMKQLGTATQLYVDDYDETLPPAYLFDSDLNPAYTDGSYSAYPCNNCKKPRTYCNPCDVAENPHWTWKDALFPYVKNCNLYYCPSDKQAVGYGINQVLIMATDAAGNVVATNVAGARPICHALAEISRASEIVLYTATQTSDQRNDTCPYYISGWYETVYPGVKSLSPRHNGGENITFCDGHAKFYKAGSDVIPKTAWEFGRTNRYWNPYIN